jgi:hypothetical protein
MYGAPPWASSLLIAAGAMGPVVAVVVSSMATTAGGGARQGASGQGGARPGWDAALRAAGGRQWLELDRARRRQPETGRGGARARSWRRHLARLRRSAGVTALGATGAQGRDREHLAAAPGSTWRGSERDGTQGRGRAHLAARQGGRPAAGGRRWEGEGPAAGREVGRLGAGG